MDQALDGEAVMLTPAQVRELDQDDRTTVLEYEYDDVERVLPMNEVQAALQQCRDDFARARTAHPEWTDEQIRETLRASPLAKTHPTIFDKATDRTTPPHVFETLAALIAIRQRQERGLADDNATALAVEAAIQPASSST